MGEARRNRPGKRRRRRSKERQSWTSARWFS